MTAIFYMALKDLRLLIRDRFGLFWIFVFPLVFALFFGTIFGSGGGSRGAIQVVVIDDANNDGSRAFIEKLVGADGLGVAEEDAGIDLQAARELVQKGERVAYIRLPEGYGGNAFALFTPDAGKLIEIGIDPSRSAERGLIQGMVSQLAFQGAFTQFNDDQAMATQIAAFRTNLKSADGMTIADRMVLDTFMGSLDNMLQQTDMQLMPAGEDATEGPSMAPVVEVVEVTRDMSGRPRSSFELTFPSSIVWALMGCVATFSLSMVRERTMGTLLRLRVAPLSFAQILAGKALACFLACTVVEVVLLTIGWAMLGVRIANWPLMLATLVFSALCFTGIMMSISVIGKTENAVAGAGWGVLMPFAMVGGGMIPLVAMPEWLLSVSHFSPFKWAIYSLEGAVWRDFTFIELLPSFAILLGVGVVCFAIGVYTLRRTIE